MIGYAASVLGFGRRRWPLRSIGPVTYRPDIDGLRGVAILLVILHHVGLLPFGYLGVDVFFVISGYVITQDILARQASGTFNLGGFYLRRARRIFPALAIVLGVVGVAGSALLFSDELSRLLKHIAASAGFVLNFVLLGEAGYFDAAILTKPLMHLWSLAVEEQFYLLWPLVLMLARRRAALVAALVLLLSCAAMVLLWNDHQAFSYYMLPTRGWQIMAGALLALRPIELRRWYAIPAALSAAGLVSVSPPAAAVAAALATVIMISSPVRTLSASWLVWIGGISYPLYLWHWPLLSFVHIVWPKPAGWLVWSMVLLAFLLAALTARFVERPIRRSPERSRRVAACVLAVSAVGAGSALATAAPDGHSDLLRVAASGQCPAWLDFGGMTCDGAGRRMVIGDSNAEALFPGLGAGWMVAFRPGCAPFPHQPAREGCARAQAEAIKRLAASNVETVALSFREHYSLDGLESTLQALAGKTLVLVISTPDLPFEPRDCIARPAFKPMVTDCSFSRSVTLKNQAERREHFALLASKYGVTVVDPLEVLCESERCRIDRGGLTYRDHDHISVTGAKLVGALVQRSLESSTR